MSKNNLKFNDMLLKLSFRRKITLFFSIFLTIEILFIFFYFPVKFEKIQYDSIKEKAKSIGELTAFSIGPGFFFTDKEAIEDALSGVKQLKDISYIVVSNTKNEVVSSFNFTTAKNVNYSETSENAFNEKEEIYKFSSPIYYKDSNLGTLYIGFSIKDVNKEINNSRNTVILISLILFILNIAAVIFISNILVRPLSKIAKGFEKISKGDFSTRVNSKGNDEIANLINSFNTMADKLEDTYNQLQQENSARKETEINLHHAKDELALALEQEKTLNDLKTRFISIVSHEYRTPMTAILTSTYLLDIFFQRQLKDDFDKHIKKIQQAIDEMTNLLNDVMIVGKIDAGKVTLNLTEIDIVKYISELFKQAEMLDKKEHIYIFKSDIETCVIQTDENLITHIFNNLIFNAIKYSAEKSEIMIDIQDIRDVIKIDIIDAGIGIPMEEHKYLFDQFFRANNVGKVGGTGLGLSIVKKYVDMLNYKITFTSEINEGTTFSVFLNKK